MRIVALENLQQFAAVNFSSDPGAVGGPVVIPQCAEIALLWTLADAKIAHCVLHGRYSGGFVGSVAQANAIMTALTTGASWTTMAAAIPTGVNFTAVTIRDLNIANQPIIQSSNAAVPGTSASPALPSEMAIVITHRTAQVGRGFRGRTYISGWATNTVSAGDVIAPSTVTALQNWANTIAGALSGSGYTFVIGQRARAAYVGTTGVAHPARAANTVPITSSVVRDNHWDTQRRRGLK